MSKLYDVEGMYGQDFGISVTNAPANIIKNNGKQFIKNSLIISSPNNGEMDDGYPSLFASDYEGNISQITYAIEQKNGLYINNNQRLAMNIDHSTIQESNNELYVETENLTYCGFNQLGIVQVKDVINERENTKFPINSYISVNDTGTIYLADSFYNYIWNYVKNEISLAIQPLIPINYSGYLIKEENNVKDHIYQSNMVNIPYTGSLLNYGFYYTSGEKVNTSLSILNPENNTKVISSGISPKIDINNEYYNIIGYGHLFDINTDNPENPIVPIKLVFPPNFYRSGNNFINKLYKIYINIIGESENSEWNKKQLVFNFLQEAGNFKINTENNQIDISQLELDRDIQLSFSTNNFPTNSNIDDSVKSLVEYKVNLIWDADGYNINLLDSPQKIDLNKITNFSLRLSMNGKENLKKYLNPQIASSESSSEYILNANQSKKYTLRIETINTQNNTLISIWDNPFPVTYDIIGETTQSTAIIRNLYITEVCLGSDDAYIVIEDVQDELNPTAEINIDWQYGEDNSSPISLRKGANNTSSEKTLRVNHIFNRADSNIKSGYYDETYFMSLFFDFKYDDDIINNIDEDIYDKIFDVDAFVVKLQLRKPDGSIITENPFDYVQTDVIDFNWYTKSVENEQKLIDIYFEDIEDEKNKNIKISFNKIISPDLFIDCIKSVWNSTERNYDNYVSLSIIISNNYLSTQVFNLKINVDSLIMGSIKYSFTKGLLDNDNNNYYINSGMAGIYGSEITIDNMFLYQNENYELKFDKVGRITSVEPDTENNPNLITINNNVPIKITFENDTPGNEYNLKMQIFGTYDDQPKYRRIITFGSNIINCDYPLFRIYQPKYQYHFIYLSTLHDNYKLISNYEMYPVDPVNDQRIMKLAEAKTGVSINNFIYSTELAEITENQNILITDDNLDNWYAPIGNKYLINGGNEPLLNVELVPTNTILDISAEDLTEITGDLDEEQQNTYGYIDEIIKLIKYVSNLNGTDDQYTGDNKLLPLPSDISRPVNMYYLPSNYSGGNDSYYVGHGANQQTNETWDFTVKGEKLNYTLGFDLRIKPSNELESWLYSIQDATYPDEYGYGNDIKGKIKTILLDLIPALSSKSALGIKIIDQLNIRTVEDQDNKKISFITTFINNDVEYEDGEFKNVQHTDYGDYIGISKELSGAISEAGNKGENLKNTNPTFMLGEDGKTIKVDDNHSYETERDIYYCSIENIDISPENGWFKDWTKTIGKNNKYEVEEPYNNTLVKDNTNNSSIMLNEQRYYLTQIPDIQVVDNYPDDYQDGLTLDNFIYYCEWMGEKELNIDDFNYESDDPNNKYSQNIRVGKDDGNGTSTYDQVDKDDIIKIKNTNGLHIYCKLEWKSNNSPNSPFNQPPTEILNINNDYNDGYNHITFTFKNSFDTRLFNPPYELILYVIFPGDKEYHRKVLGIAVKITQIVE